MTDHLSIGPAARKGENKAGEKKKSFETHFHFLKWEAILIQPCCQAVLLNYTHFGEDEHNEKDEVMELSQRENHITLLN